MIMCNALRGNAMDLRAEISFLWVISIRTKRSCTIFFFFFGYRNDVRIGFE